MDVPEVPTKLGDHTFTARANAYARSWQVFSDEGMGPVAYLVPADENSVYILNGWAEKIVPGKVRSYKKALEYISNYLSRE